MSTTPAPDQSAKAAAAITDALFASPDAVTHSTARLIAAALHPGPGSALQQLAATGRFSPDVLRREVLALRVPTNREPWRQALVRYLDSVRARSHPWARSAVRSRGPALRHERSSRSPFA